PWPVWTERSIRTPRSATSWPRPCTTFARRRGPWAHLPTTWSGTRTRWSTGSPARPPPKEADDARPRDPPHRAGPRRRCPGPGRLPGHHRRDEVLCAVLVAGGAWRPRAHRSLDRGDRGRAGAAARLPGPTPGRHP